jgi:hypothetical protein
VRHCPLREQAKSLITTREQQEIRFHCGTRGPQGHQLLRRKLRRGVQSVRDRGLGSSHRHGVGFTIRAVSAVRALSHTVGLEGLSAVVAGRVEGEFAVED